MFLRAQTAQNAFAAGASTVDPDPDEEAYGFLLRKLSDFLARFGDKARNGIKGKR